MIGNSRTPKSRWLSRMGVKSQAYCALALFPTSRSGLQKCINYDGHDYCTDLALSCNDETLLSLCQSASLS